MYAKRINKEHFTKIKDAENTMVVDIRSPVEFRNGNISGSVNLPFKNFINELGRIDKSKRIVIYSSTMDDKDLNMGVNYAFGMGFEKIFVSDYTTLRD